MNQDQVVQQILNSDALPTLSTVASKLINITGKEETTINDITSLIAQDVSLSAKVLKVVNSAFYNFPNEVGTIQQAVAILGTNAVRSLVLSFSFLNMERPRRPGGFDYERFWEQSLAAAVSARLIMGLAQGETDPEEVFTVSLLQNVGVLILAQAYTEEYDQLLAEAANGPVDLLQLEGQKLGIDHCSIGSAAAQHWHFPDSLSLPICYHHDPDAYQGNQPAMKQVAEVTFLAGLVANILYSGRPIDFAESFRREARERLKFTGKEVDKVLETVDREVAAAAEFFGLKIDGTPSVPEILQKANIELSLLNMSYEQMNRELVEAKVELERVNVELQEKNSYLEQIANLDGLTEVYNHRYFQEHLQKELSRAERSGNSLSLVMADLDKFKSINDFYGHQAGDFVLKDACRVWGEQLRGYDLLARYGGEEFIVILPETDLEEALVVAEKLRDATTINDFRNGADCYRVTASFGVALFDPENPQKQSDLIAQADQALYSAKRNGRNRVEIYREKKAGLIQRLKGKGG